MNIPFPFFATMEAADYTKPEWEQKKNIVAPEQRIWLYCLLLHF